MSVEISLLPGSGHNLSVFLFAVMQILPIWPFLCLHFYVSFALKQQWEARLKTQYLIFAAVSSEFSFTADEKLAFNVS